MKNFSLKALGATFIAAALVLLGTAAPAHAAASFTGASSYTAGTGFADGSVLSSGANTANTFRSINISANWGISSTSFNPLSTCLTSGSTFAQCGISRVVAGGQTYTSTGGGVTVKGLTSSSNQINYIQVDFATDVSSGSPVSVTFLANALTAPDVNGSYTLTMSLQNTETFTAPLTVTGARSRVMMYRNFDGSDMTMTSQQAASSTALTTNSYTRAGYNFCGWASSRSGAVAYADGASFSFTSPNSPTEAQQSMSQIYAKWSATPCGGGSSSSATANMTLSAATGQLVAGSTVAVAASGLQSTAAYTVVVQSTPQTIGSGNAVSGAVNTSVTLPSGLEAGWHTLTFTSTAADGSTVTSVSYFKISSSGTLLETTTTTPTELASTGFNAAPYLSTGAVLALAGAVLILFARRRQTS